MTYCTNSDSASFGSTLEKTKTRSQWNPGEIVGIRRDKHLELGFHSEYTSETGIPFGITVWSRDSSLDETGLISDTGIPIGTV